MFIAAGLVAEMIVTAGAVLLLVVGGMDEVAVVLGPRDAARDQPGAQ